MKKILSLIIAILTLFSLCLSISAENTITPDGSWKIKVSSQLGTSGNNLFDGNTGTNWHSAYTVENGNIATSDSAPFIISVEFGKEMEVSGFIYTPRTNDRTGAIKTFNVYATTGDGYKKIYEGEFYYEDGLSGLVPQTASWGNVKMNGIKIEITEGIGGFGAGSEITFIEGSKGTAIKDGEAFKGEEEETEEAEDTSALGTKLQKTDGWIITASSQQNDTGYSVLSAFDGNEKTIWHTAYKAEDGVVVSHDECPHIITVTFPEKTKVSGWRYVPRSDNASGTVLEYNIYASADGTSFEKIYQGSFSYIAGDAALYKPSGATWGDKEAKAIKIEITKSLGGFGTAKEIEFYTGGNAAAEEKEESKVQDNKATNSKGWKISVNSEMWSSGAKLIDGDRKTNWHSYYKAEGSAIVDQDVPPYEIEVILPAVTEISGVTLVPRTELTGLFLEVDLYVSDSDEGEYFLIKEDMAFENRIYDREIPLTANIGVKKIKIVATSTVGGFGTLSEIELMEKDSAKESVSFSEYAANEEANRMYKVDTADAEVIYEGENWFSHTPDHAIDGASSTFWQTEELPKGFAALIDIDLQKTYRIKEIDYTPRQSEDLHGHWLGFGIYTSEDGVNWTHVKDVSFEKDLSVKKIVFDEEIEARYFEFEIYEYFASRVSAAEITFLQTKEGKEASLAANTKKYTLKIGSKEIAYEKGADKGSKEIDVAPFITNGSTMIPLRGLIEEMGGKITWDGETQTIGVDNGKYEITLQICNHLVYVKDPVYGNIRYTLLNYPIISESRTFIPVRFVSEQLGYSVSWDGTTGTVTISK
ncbi:MAG: discoidin domain-containing protein [Clostridia bacterium]|nr:discoidin domain-containing protein [Clostridia bacterium]